MKWYGEVHLKNTMVKPNCISTLCENYEEFFFKDGYVQVQYKCFMVWSKDHEYSI